MCQRERALLLNTLVASKQLLLFYLTYFYLLDIRSYCYQEAVFVLGFHFWPKSVLEEDQTEKHLLKLLSYCMGFANMTFYSLPSIFP